MSSHRGDSRHPDVAHYTLPCVLATCTFGRTDAGQRSAGSSAISWIVGGHQAA